MSYIEEVPKNCHSLVRVKHIVSDIHLIACVFEFSSQRANYWIEINVMNHLF